MIASICKLFYDVKPFSYETDFRPVGPLMKTQISPNCKFFFFFASTAGVTEGMRASLRELEDQSGLLTQMRREMATTREIITRIRMKTASINSLGPFLNPVEPPRGNDMGDDAMDIAAAADLGQPTADTSFLGGGRMSLARSASDLIRLGSTRSTRSPSALPVINSFTTTRM